jgi:hypothetical protein
MEIPMIRPDDEKSMAKDLGEIWTDARRYRSQLPQSRIQCRVSDDDRAVYGKWCRGVIIFYGLLALLFLATGTMGRITDAKQAMESAQPNVSSTATRTPNRDRTFARSSPDLAPTTYDQ